ncbi:MAG: glycosyltransferase [Planctomyces sp.]|nr:glycosyltransferase [Planctomyces sp.]
MHVCHLITGLGPGGTPVMLRNVLASLRTRGLTFSVINMTHIGPAAEQLEWMGIEVHHLRLSPGVPDPRGLWRVTKLLRALKPDVLQTWLYHADLLGALAGPLCGRPPLIWNLRHATLQPGVDSRSTLLAARACARLSRSAPRLILANSRTGLQTHVDAGYDGARMRLIPNGFDTTRFRPDPLARAEIRGELGVGEQTPLIGLAARYSRLKGSDIFIRAMQRLSQSRPDARFVMCGDNIHSDNAPLRAALRESASDRFLLLGERTDMPRVQAALDIAVSASVSEAFSNSLGEALACGVPVVTTDAGDSADLVGEAGFVVPINDADALADACFDLLQRPAEHRRRLGERGRQRIERLYSIDAAAEQYLSVWREVGGAAARAAA